MTLSLTAYRLLTKLAAPAFPFILSRRARRGKEDPVRRHERLGQPRKRRPDGQLVWLHGASVGESLVLATLVDELGGLHPGLNFLVTTGTTTSAALMATRLPSNARHQYVPVDTPGAVAGFLDHWSPDLAVFAESEIWPNLILATHQRDIPMALVNARMNARSLRNWQRRPDSAARLLGCFAWIGAADKQTYEGLEDLLGKTLSMVGNLKLEAQPPKPDPHLLSAAKVNTAGRRPWLAASSHEGEEGVILSAHANLMETHPGALLILAPRHPERGDRVERLIKSRGMTCARRSRDEVPQSGDAVWLADTLGEMPLWYALVKPALIAGSLKKGIGGHNPIEASHFGSQILTGRHVASFQDVYDSYERHDALIYVDDAAGLTRAVADIWDGQGLPEDNAHKAIRHASGGALEATLAALSDLLSDNDDADSNEVDDTGSNTGADEP